MSSILKATMSSSAAATDVHVSSFSTDRLPDWEVNNWQVRIQIQETQVIIIFHSSSLTTLFYANKILVLMLQEISDLHYVEKSFS
jgi:hypothetical protein